MKRAALFALGCAALLVLLLWIGGPTVLQSLGALGVTGLLLAALLHLPVLALMGWAWAFAAGEGRAPRAFLVARFVRDAGAEALPLSQLGGFAMGLRMLHLGGRDSIKTGTALFGDLVMEFASKLPYTVAGLLALAVLVPGAEGLAAMTLVVAGLIAAVAAAIALRHRFRALLQGAATRMLQGWTSAATVENAQDAIAAGLTVPRLGPSFVLHLLCWFIGAAETYVIFALLGHPVSFAAALVIDSLANAVRTFGFFVPAAAGVQEGAYIGVSALLGLPPGPAMAFSLARRARDLVLAAPALIWWQAAEARKR